MKSQYFFFLLFSLILVTPIYSLNLIGHWDFEEGGGSTAFNSSEHGNLDGSIVGANYTTDSAKGNFALDFDGDGDYVEVLNNSLLVPNTIGISFWFKPRSAQLTHADIIDKGHGGHSTPYHGGYAFQYNGDNSSFFSFYGNGSNFVGHSSGSGNYKDSQWHHVVANLGADEITLYIDGNLISTSAGQGPLVQNNANLYFGRHANCCGLRYFNGLIDEIKLYDGALSSPQATNLQSGIDPLVPEANTWVLLSFSLFFGLYLKNLKR